VDDSRCARRPVDLIEIVELLREPELRTRHSVPATQSVAIVHPVGTARELWLLRSWYDHVPDELKGVN